MLKYLLLKMKKLLLVLCAMTLLIISCVAGYATDEKLGDNSQEERELEQNDASFRTDIKRQGIGKYDKGSGKKK
ncbi:hypothetical protein Btru_075939 [Bulinus truncatus]|nr:hypothetical protein Btru_075939 [Bulinus truncatus]